MQSDVVLNAAHWMYLVSVAAIILTMIPVSYTHLDVYKRQYKDTVLVTITF